MPDLPVHDDLELVLRASEVTVATPAPSPAPAASSAAVLRPRRPGKDKEFAMENSVQDLQASFEALRPRLAMTWPFELDAFQKEGVVLMEEGESVFVAAHTSAGACFAPLSRLLALPSSSQALMKQCQLACAASAT